MKYVYELEFQLEIVNIYKARSRAGVNECTVMTYMIIGTPDWIGCLSHQSSTIQSEIVQLSFGL